MESKRSLVIRADASSRIGAGHVMRCLALAHAGALRGVRVIFVASQLPEIFERRILDEGHEFRRIDAASGSDKDAWRTAQIATETAAASVVVDLYDGNPAYLESLGGQAFATLCIDDNAGLERYPVDFVLNLNGHAKAAQYESKTGPETRLLLGPKYALLRREFLPFRDWQRPRDSVAQKILCSLGGGNQIPVFVAILDRLAIALKSFELSFVLARPDFDTAPLEEAARRHGLSHRLLISPPDMAVALKEHDTLISSGGSTVWEALFMQMPAVFIAVADNQVNSCLALQRMIRHPVFTSIAEISDEAFTSVARDASLRNVLAQSGRSIVDGNGAERVIAEIFNPTMYVKNQ